MAFQSVDPEIWKHENENEVLTGWLMSVTPNSGKYKSTAYKFEEFGSHRKWIIFGNNLLDDKMTFAKVGDLVRITYLGKETSATKQQYNNYKVEIDDGKEGTPEVQTADKVQGTAPAPAPAQASTPTPPPGQPLHPAYPNPGNQAALPTDGPTQTSAQQV